MIDKKTETSYTSFLGTGWSFPPEFIQGTGEVLMTEDEEDVANSLRILFGTALGERFLKPDYGLDIHEMLFEPISTTMKTYLEDRIKMTVLIHEARINLLSLEIDTSAQNEGRISIVVEYELRGTNSRYNLVYPFYTSDSSEVRGPVLHAPDRTW
jgi:uncharacterized protein